MMYGYIIFRAAGDTAEIKQISKKDVPRLVEHIRECIALMHQHTTSAPQAATSKADELRKLADLHDAGVLTEEEFQSEKQSLGG